VDEQEPDLKRRVSEIQAQLDRLSTVVEHPAEGRESQLLLLTQQCAEILDRWTLTELRHTRAIGEMEARLNDWERFETRVEQNTHELLHELERKIEQEWLALRHMLEEPVRQIQEHSASLRETSVATAGSALVGLERAEARLATIHADVSDRMSQLSRDVQAVVAELRAGPPRSGPPVPADVPSWPLNQVMRLHNELRETEGDGGYQPGDRAPTTITLVPEAAASLSHRIESVEQAVTTGEEIVRETFERAEHKRRSASRTVLALLAIGFVIATAFAVRLQRQIEVAAARINAAEQEGEVARAIADRQIAESHKDAERQVAEAKETALKAQFVSEVLAASDLARYALYGGETAPMARGQVLWSRSRGFVFSGSNVPQVPPDSTYQLWLLTTGGAVSVAEVKPDTKGRISVVIDPPPIVPRPVVNVVLTLEPQGGRPTPSGVTVLARQLAVTDPQPSSENPR
jgi:Anti-sigma-K factor rskA